MPMRERMNVPWPMGHGEWLELTVFWIAAALAVLFVTGSLTRRRGAPPSTARPHPRSWLALPELRLLMLALPIELLWEIAQFPLYDVWHQNDWAYILYGLAHCTLGDLLILLIVYEVLALLNRDRRWYTSGPMVNGLLFTLLGAGYTVFSEFMNVRVKGTWGYTELMPIVPVLNVGGMPLLQWLLIPPILLWLLRLYSPRIAARQS